MEQALLSMFVGFGFAVLETSCALPFTDYPVGRPDGTPCSSNGECLDGHCLPSNAGDGSVCCRAACIDMGGDSCGTNGRCDAGGGGCALYPPGTPCLATTCEVGMLTRSACQAGSCIAGKSVPCPGGLACEDKGACKTTCATEKDCETQGATCPPASIVDGSPIYSTFCVGEPDGAPCGTSDQCHSLLCGTTGTGHCCTQACTPLGGQCGATDCDDSGKCVYPDTTTACGSSSSCTHSNLTSDYCNGTGGCAGISMKPCPGHLRCAGPNSCDATCGSSDPTGDARCNPGYWCDGSACRACGHPFTACGRPGECCSGNCVNHVCSF